MVPVVMALVPIGAQFLYALGIHVKRRKGNRVIVTELRRSGRRNIDLPAEPFALAIDIQLTKILIKRAVLLQHINDVVDYSYACRTPGRRRRRRILICTGNPPAPCSHKAQADNQDTDTVDTMFAV